MNAKRIRHKVGLNSDYFENGTRTLNQPNSNMATPPPKRKLHSASIPSLDQSENTKKQIGSTRFNKESGIDKRRKASSYSICNANLELKKGANRKRRLRFFCLKACENIKSVCLGLISPLQLPLALTTVKWGQPVTNDGLGAIKRSWFNSRFVGYCHIVLTVAMV